jgi:DNA processing protein
MSRGDSSSDVGDTSFDVCVLGDSKYPQQLAHDPEAPGVLFVQGDIGCLDRPRVGIIGTRHATAHGRSCARHFGDVLSAHGVAVVSGLARGIDVSAHRGVLQRIADSPCSLDDVGRPIGVVASGLDVVYPPEHGEVWADVARRGVLLSESPPGTEPHAFRFPLRNRIIAALCDVLVVVESKITGGSMITVRAALERQVTVMAVPGSTSTRASEGTNLLIRDGASIAVEPEDVLAVLGIESHRRVAKFDPRQRPSSEDAKILELLGDDPMTLDHIVSRTRRDLGEVALALGRLEARGWLMCTAGWFEKVSDPD